MSNPSVDPQLNENSPKVYSAIVLGAGITGMVSANVLHDLGSQSTLMIDTFEKVGGNHIDAAIGPYTFDVGSLIFQDDSPLVKRFPEILGGYVPIDPRWSRINPQGQVTTYPISIVDDLVKAGPVEWLRIGSTLVWGRLTRRHHRNAYDFAAFWLGTRLLARSGLRNYMTRFCGLPPEQIDLDFARSRMGWIAEHARIGTHVGRFINRLRARCFPASRGPEPVRNQQLARPREGFEALYAPAVRKLESFGVEVRLSEPFVSVHKDGEEFVLTTERGVYRAGRLISTIPIDQALALIGAKQEQLPTVTLVTLFYSFRGARGFDDSVLYNFSDEGAWKRLTMHSDFYGTADGREFFCVEVVNVGVDTDVPAEDQAFRDHTARNGLFVGDLVLEGNHVMGNAYPIFTGGAAQRAEHGRAVLADFGIESFGRQGGFEYQPTARMATIQAEKALGVEPSE